MTNHNLGVCLQMSFQWYLFLISGLGMGIRQWDVAAAIIGRHPQQTNSGTSP